VAGSTEGRPFWETRVWIVFASWVLLILMQLSGVQVRKPIERAGSISCICAEFHKFIMAPTLVEMSVS
jgi:hypothetical protein